MAKIKIYTGYYGKVKHYVSLGYIPVSISKSVPDYAQEYVTHEIEELMPHWSMFKLPKEKYTPMYSRILQKVNPRLVVNKLKGIAKQGEYQGVVLMCWKKPTEFCHRHIAARWITKYTGIRVKELKIKEPKKIYVDMENLKDE